LQRSLQRNRGAAVSGDSTVNSIYDELGVMGYLRHYILGVVVVISDQHTRKDEVQTRFAND